MVFFSYKMILAVIRYKMHDNKPLAIVDAFKTWIYYLEGSQHKIFVLFDYNNLRHFMITKSLSSKQAYWAQKLCCFHFWIND